MQMMWITMGSLDWRQKMVVSEVVRKLDPCMNLVDFDWIYLNFWFFLLKMIGHGIVVGIAMVVMV